MLNNKEIEQCQRDWESAEMSDLSSSHLDKERLSLYHKWFAKMLDHIQNRNNLPWHVVINQVELLKNVIDN